MGMESIFNRFGRRRRQKQEAEFVERRQSYPILLKFFEDNPNQWFHFYEIQSMTDINPKHIKPALRSWAPPHDCFLEYQEAENKGDMIGFWRHSNYGDYNPDCFEPIDPDLLTLRTERANLNLSAMASKIVEKSLDR